MPDELAGFLSASPVFAAVPRKDIQPLVAVARESRYAAREYIFEEDDPAAWFCVVRTGRVRIFRRSRTGKDVVLELLGPGEPFGAVAVIERRPYPASAQATEPSVVVKIPPEPIIALSERYPSVVREMALLIGRRLRSAHDSVEALASDPVEARLATTLVRLAERDGSPARHGTTLPFHLTRQGLADMAGTTVETTIRVLSRWIKDGLVREQGGHLVIPAVDALRKVAEGEQE
jgi:CRP/FNR family transcriptional regulator, nitrogen oxide reductase regulator